MTRHDTDGRNVYEAADERARGGRVMRTLAIPVVALAVAVGGTCVLSHADTASAKAPATVAVSVEDAARSASELKSGVTSYASSSDSRLTDLESKASDATSRADAIDTGADEAKADVDAQVAAKAAADEQARQEAAAAAAKAAEDAERQKEEDRARAKADDEAVAKANSERSAQSTGSSATSRSTSSTSSRATSSTTGSTARSTSARRTTSSSDRQGQARTPAEAVTWLAMRCASGVNTGLQAPGAWPWNKIDDPRLYNEYAVMDATVLPWGGNAAYASCTQAAACVIAATIDPDIGASGGGSGGPEAMLDYLSSHPETYQEVSGGYGALEPGDILASTHHTAIWVGQDAVSDMYPGQAGNVYQANYGAGSYANYPEIVNYSQDDFNWLGLRVFRPVSYNTHASHPLVDYESLVS